MNTVSPEPYGSKHERRIPPAGDGLVPSLSLFTTTMIVIGGVIGSGIFRKPGVMASQVGSPELLLLVWLVAAVVISALTAINCVGVRLGGLVQNIFTAAKVAAMLLLVLGAFLLPTGGKFENLVGNSPAIHREGLALWAAMAAALQGAFWAYDGWNKITYIAGEVKDPRRNIPRSLFTGMAVVTALYLLLNVAYTFVLPIDVLAGSKLVR